MRRAIRPLPFPSRLPRLESVNWIFHRVKRRIRRHDAARNSAPLIRNLFICRDRTIRKRARRFQVFAPDAPRAHRQCSVRGSRARTRLRLFRALNYLRTMTRSRARCVARRHSSRIPASPLLPAPLPRSHRQRGIQRISFFERGLMMRFQREFRNFAFNESSRAFH